MQSSIRTEPPPKPGTALVHAERFPLANSPVKRHQRRNLTDEQKTYMIGKMYEARKKSITNESGRNQYTKVVEDHNDLQPKPKSTAEAIGREIGDASPTHHNVRNSRLFRRKARSNGQLSRDFSLTGRKRLSAHRSFQGWNHRDSAGPCSSLP